MPGMMRFIWRIGAMMLAPSTVWVFMTSNSSAVSLPGFCRIASWMPILPTSCISEATWMSLITSSGSPSSRAMMTEYRLTRIGVAAGVGVLGVDGLGQRPDRAQEQLLVLLAPPASAGGSGPRSRRPSG